MSESEALSARHARVTQPAEARCTPGPGGDRPSAYHIAVVLWGDSYVDTYLALALPTQLADGNLPALSETNRVVYRIYTTAEGRRTIEESRLFVSLSSVAEVEFVAIADPGDHVPPLTHMSRFHHDAVRRARDENAAVVTLQADNGLSDGSLASAADALARGKRAVLSAGPRVSERVLQHLPPPSSSRGEIALSGADVASLACTYPHGEQLAMMWSAGEFTSWPGNLVWEVPGEGLLIHGFFFSPIVLWLREDDPLPTLENLGPYSTMDGWYIARAVPELDEVHLVRESDEFALFSVDRDDKVFETRAQSRVMDVAVWARDRCVPHNLAFVRIPIAYRTRPPSSAWQDTERRASRIVNSILWLVRLRCLGADYWHADKSKPRAWLAAAKHAAVARTRATLTRGGGS